jgi:hypothetical protein
MTEHKIDMRTYGKFLHGREEASFAFLKLKEELSSNSEIYIFDLSNVLVLAPSYCDELFANLTESFPDRVKILCGPNEAHKIAFETVEETRGTKFSYID